MAGIAPPTGAVRAGGSYIAPPTGATPAGGDVAPPTGAIRAGGGIAPPTGAVSVSRETRTPDQQALDKIALDTNVRDVLTGYTALKTQQILATRARKEFVKDAPEIFSAPTVAGKAWGALKTLGDAFEWTFSPFETAGRFFVGDPGAKITGKPIVSTMIGNAASDAASLALDPFKAIGAAGSAVKSSKIGTGIAKIVAPTSLTPGARQVGGIVSEHAARLAQSTQQAMNDLEQFRGHMDNLPEAQQLDFIDRMEKGLPQQTQEATAVATELRRQLDLWRNKIQSLGKGKLQNAIQNYMPHIWGNYQEWKQGIQTAGTTAARTFGQAVSKRPIKGSGAFLKQRTFDTVADGIAAGLKPVTTNPLDLTLLKLREMQKFYHGSQMADEIKQSGLATFFKPSQVGAARAAGLVALNDSAFEAKTTKAGQGLTQMGQWYAPEHVARIFNNYVSQGLAGRNELFDALRGAGNTLNMAQLGLSGLHATFVALDTMISRVALGLKEVSKGRVLSGARNILGGISPHTIVRTIRRGSKLREAYLNPQGASPEMRKLVESLTKGGGRISMDTFYRAHPSGGFMKAIQRGTVFREVKDAFKGTLTDKALAPLNLAARTVETVSQPLMEVMVPRAKLGVFYDMAESYLKAHPNATPLEIREAMQASWDSVDNRMGQMVYDNVFWNKTLKDIAFLTVRSVGWNLGTLRELGGGVVDAAGNVVKLGQGQATELTNRTAYTIAMPAVTAMYGAVLTYMMTGHGPKQMLDYFYPPTGKLNAKGDPDRISIPGYIKDVVAYNRAPVATVLGKANPIIETGEEIHNNRDFYGGIIDAPTDNPYAAYTEYLLKQALPFSIRGAMKERQDKAGALDQALAFWGFIPAPGYITNPAREEAYQKRQDAIALRKRQKENQ